MNNHNKNNTSFLQKENEWQCYPCKTGHRELS